MKEIQLEAFVDLRKTEQQHMQRSFESLCMVYAAMGDGKHADQVLSIIDDMRTIIKERGLNPNG